jgi:hypothetical protein
MRQANAISTYNFLFPPGNVKTLVMGPLMGSFSESFVSLGQAVMGLSLVMFDVISV